MAKVAVTKSKLETLAAALRAKLGFTGKMTIDALTQQVNAFTPPAGVKTIETTVTGTGINRTDVSNTAGITKVLAVEASAQTTPTELGVVAAGVYADSAGIARVPYAGQSLNLAVSMSVDLQDGMIRIRMQNTAYTFGSGIVYDVTIYGT